MNRFVRVASALAAVALVALSGCSEDEKQCEDFCGAGAACVAGSCVAYEPCPAACATGQACQDGACVATLESACGGSCVGADQICVTSGGAAECVAVCGDGQAWSSATHTCVATAAYCGAGQVWNASTLTCEATAAYCGAGQTWDPVALRCALSDVHAAWFEGKTLANGPAVTAECIGCHADEAADFMLTQHWSWRGPTPQLYGGVDFAADPATLRDPGTIGKANLINNFCVSVASNDKRCEQCHAGYGNAATNVSARSAALAGDPTRVDCLVCHTARIQGNMAGSPSATAAEGALYNKVAGAFGAAGYAVGPGASVASPEQLRSFAQNVQRPTRENCGWCHFNGGGADSVKIMGTQLRAPGVATDVHMSPDLAGGGHDMTCADCHSAGRHGIRGAGIHTPTNSARLACRDCHATPHATAALGSTLNRHLDVLACQTCHIPSYSRAMPQKLDWDWSTAGAKALGTLYACVSGTTEVPYDGNGCLTAGGAKVKKYDFMKGTFAWGQGVKPTYRWYNGKMTHVTIADKGAFTVETGLTKAAADRITLSAPLGDAADPTALIAPFKVMTGRQAVYVDDAAGSSFVITPNLFGEVVKYDAPNTSDPAFWAVLSAQAPATKHAYAFGGTFTADAFGAPAAPLAGPFTLGATADTGAATAFGPYAFGTAYELEAMLADVFTKGAIAAGQVDAGTPTFARYAAAGGGAPAVPGWDWRYTKMYLDLEHEVAPKGSALGCAACHSDTGASVIDWTQLGYSCANPSGCPKRP